MNSTDLRFGPPLQLAQLLRLRQMRVDAAEAQVREQRAVCEAGETAVQARLGHIDTDRQRVERHAAYLVGDGAADLPRFAASFLAHGERLDDALERSEYGLIADQEMLNNNQARLLERRQGWLREQARQHGLAEALRRSRAAQTRRADRQAEDEADERPCSGGPLAAPSPFRKIP